MRHRAIYSLYPNVVSIDDGAGAFDADGNSVAIDEDAVAAEIERLTPIVARESASLSRADFKLGLLDMGELDNVKAAMADPNTDPRVVVLWEDAERFNRMHPDLLSFAQVMGYSEQQLDQLFGVLLATNVNTADFDTLRELNGVDEVRAQAIIDGRPWNDVNDLITIQGISQEMVDSWDIMV